MKRLPLLLLVLLTIASAAAQNRYWLSGGGAYAPGTEVTLSAWLEGNPPTDLILHRVENPGQFLALGGPGEFGVTPGLDLTEVMSREVTVQAEAGTSVSFGQLETGMYLAQLGPPELAAATIILVTDLGLVSKRDGEKLLTYTADLQSGEPRAARLFFGSGENVTEAPGSETGVSTFAAADLPAGDSLPVGAQAGDSWAFNDTWWNSWAADVPAHYLVTDRPVYRPGETVFIKGTVRLARSLEAVAGQDVRIEVRDADYEVALATTATTDEFGSFSFPAELPQSASEGAWSISSELAGTSGWQTFRVEDYRSPEYEVGVTRQEAYAIQDAETAFTVEARYLSGGSPGGADVSWVVLSEPYSPWAWRSEFGFYTDTSGTYGGTVIARGEGTLGEDGTLTIPVTLTRRDEDYRLTLQASVSDESGRQQTAGASMIAYRADLVLGVSTASYASPLGEEVAVTVTARDLEGNPVQVDFELASERRYWLEGVGPTAELGPVLTGTTNRSGEAVLLINPDRAGSWHLSASARDARGRLTDGGTDLWLYGGDAWYWEYRNLEITPDRDEYEPGDTARFVVESPVADGWALIVQEGSGIRSAEVLRFEGNAFTFEITVSDTDLPNSYVSVAVAGQGELYTAAESYRVNPGSRFLDIDIAFPADTFEPGAETDATISVRDASGEPVKAQLTVALVDEAVFLIRPDQVPDIRGFFYDWRGNNVNTALSTWTYFGQVAPTGQPRAAMDEAVFGQAKAQAEASAGADPEQARLRETFADTIVWLTDLVTGDDGTADVRITFPDNLTRWRLTARAVSTDGKVGQATANVTTTLPLIARLVLPRYLVAGDTTRARVIGQNNLEKTITARFGLTTEGLLVTHSPAATVTDIPPGERATADWQLQAAEPGTGTVEGSVLSADAGDAMKLPLETRPRAVPAEAVWAGAAGDAWVFTIPEGTDPGSITGSIQLSPGLSAAVKPAADWLSGQPDTYPELAISRLLAAVWSKQAGLGQPADVSDLDEYVRAGLAALYRQQHPDGGWGFGRFDISDPAVSARVTAGLTSLREAGFNVQEWQLERALTYLEAAARKDAYAAYENLTPGERARLNADAHAEIWLALNRAGRDTSGLAGTPGNPALSGKGLATSVLAEIAGGNETAANVYLDELLGRLTVREAVAYLEPDGPYWSAASDRVQGTAQALEALARLRPDSELLPLLANWLLLERQGRSWYAGPDTAAVLRAALALPASEAETVTVTLELNGQPHEVTVGPSGSSTDLPDGFLPGRNELTVSAPAGAAMFAAARLAYPITAGLGEPVAEGITVTREFALLEARWLEDEQRFTYRQVPADTFRAGDYVVGKVTLTSSEAVRFLEVTEPLPAGFQLVEDDWQFRLADVPSRYGTDYPGWNYWYDTRVQNRLETVFLFGRLDGELTFTYILQAEQPGTYTALPTRARLLYERDVYGRSAAQQLEVSE